MPPNAETVPIHLCSLPGVQSRRFHDCNFLRGFGILQFFFPLNYVQHLSLI